MNQLVIWIDDQVYQNTCNCNIKPQRILSGKAHFSPPGIMKERLKKEGIKIINDQVVDFEKLFWDPKKELGFD